MVISNSWHSLSCSFLHMTFSLSVSRFPSYKDTSHWIRAHHNPIWPHSKLITSAKTLFLNTVAFRGTGIRTWPYILGGQFNPQHHVTQALDLHKGIFKWQDISCLFHLSLSKFLLLKQLSLTLIRKQVILLKNYSLAKIPEYGYPGIFANEVFQAK